MIKNISAVLIVLGSLIVLSTVFTVDETEQVVILQFETHKNYKRARFKF